MKYAFTLTLMGPAAIGVPNGDGRRREPEGWLVRECESDPYAAAKEIAILIRLTRGRRTRSSGSTVALMSYKGLREGRPKLPQS